MTNTNFVHTFLLLFFVGLCCDYSLQLETLAKQLNFRLHSGDEMPLVGFGTYGIRGEQMTKDVLDRVLTAGYRLIDSAVLYENEEDIGKALKELLPKHNLTRKDIFITSKLLPDDHGPGAYDALKRSLKRFDLEYLDLFLIHWPGAFGENNSKTSNAQLREQSWESLTKAVKDGLVRNIGVSNYNVRHLNGLLAKDFGVKPAVNQIEWHPLYHPEDVKQLCQKEGILLQAYSSLGGSNNTDLIKDPVVVGIGEKLKKSPAQVLLRWGLQQNIAIIPKARSKQHIEQNLDLNFVIPEADMKILANFKQHNKYGADPDIIV